MSVNEARHQTLYILPKVDLLKRIKVSHDITQWAHCISKFSCGGMYGICFYAMGAMFHLCMIDFAKKTCNKNKKDKTRKIRYCQAITF